MEILQVICDRLIEKQKDDKNRDDVQKQFDFRELEDLKDFIDNKLYLNKTYVGKAYILKGGFLSYTDYSYIKIM